MMALIKRTDIKRSQKGSKRKEDANVGVGMKGLGDVMDLLAVPMDDSLRAEPSRAELVMDLHIKVAQVGQTANIQLFRDGVTYVGVTELDEVERETLKDLVELIEGDD